jgi:hypothetical protein
MISARDQSEIAASTACMYYVLCALQWGSRLGFVLDQVAQGGRYLSDREQLIRAASEQIFTNLELVLVQLRPETLTKCRRGELGPGAWLRSRSGGPRRALSIRSRAADSRRRRGNFCKFSANFSTATTKNLNEMPARQRLASF